MTSTPNVTEFSFIFTKNKRLLASDADSNAYYKIESI